MKLDTPVDAESLAMLGRDAVGLLCRGDIGTLAARYGYALAFGRDIATAIRQDLRGCLDELGAASLTPAPENPVQRVLFYKQPDSSNLVAVVECLAPAENGASLLVELIVTSMGGGRYITLEQISASQDGE